MKPEGEPPLHIVLLCPEIGPNAGNVGRLCLGIQATLHLVHPLGFQTDDKAVRRAGLDYWKHVNVIEHETEDAFWRWAVNRRVHLFSTKWFICLQGMFHLSPGNGSFVSG